MPKEVATTSTSLARFKAQSAPIARRGSSSSPGKSRSDRSRAPPPQSPTPEQSFTVAGQLIKLSHTDVAPELAGTTWPKNTTRVVDADGNVDYYAEPTAKLEKMWRKKIGSFLAHDVLRKAGTFWLAEWPDGYKLFVHKVGPAYSPRQDAYLYGPPHRVFRSPAEFFFHARHLMLAKDTCDCTYCGGTKQGEISKRYSNYTPKNAARRGPRTARDLLRRT